MESDPERMSFLSSWKWKWKGELDMIWALSWKNRRVHLAEKNMQCFIDWHSIFYLLHF
jgi:hypothetical protein